MSIASEMEARLQFMQFDAKARAALRGTQQVVADVLPGGLDRFYEKVRAEPAVSRFFADERHLQGAKGAQVHHWTKIVGGDFGEDYLAGVQKIGETHARIGLEPRWYIAGYAMILDSLIHGVIAGAFEKKRGPFAGKDDGTDTADAVSALVKAALVDMDIAISVYIENAERARVVAEKQATEQSQKIVVDSFGAGLTALASGDLTYRLKQDVPAAYRQLQADFNAAMEQMQDALREVTANADTMRTSAAEIGQAADDLSRRTEQQAASLEETAAALDEVTATVGKTATLAGQADAKVATTRAEAEKSGDVVRRAVLAMEAIEGSARQISQIIGVIDEIAFQTNLLALNAGVEAARAGDAGRGFAVVASEVRTLAQRSAEAAKDIKQLIATSTAHVDSGVTLVGDTGSALARIMAGVTEASTIVAEIAASAREQSLGLGEVNIAVNQMDQVTQQNAAMVEQSTAASHSLARDSDRLAELVRRFEIGQTAAPRAHGRGVVAMHRR